MDEKQIGITKINGSKKSGFVTEDAVYKSCNVAKLPIHKEYICKEFLLTNKA